MSGVFDFLHIKGRTAGSSNELSFDVLEQKSVEAEEKANRGSKTPKPPKASQGSYHGVAGTTTLSGQAEVERRKRARQASRMRLYAFITVLLVVLIGAGVYAGIRFHEKQVDMSMRIDSLVDRLVKADEVIVEIDEDMKNPFNPERTAERSKELASMKELLAELESISEDAQSLESLSTDGLAEVTVNQISKTAQARYDMVSAAQAAFQLSADASKQVKRANKVWADVLNSDQIAREAIAVANKATTQDATKDSLEKTKKARADFEEAYDELGRFSAMCGVVFADQQAFLLKKMDALDCAIETSEALLAGDRERATAANEKYNSLDQEAAELAAKLPAAIGDLVQEQFDLNMVKYQENYQRYRDETVRADSVIRDYLGR